jgi:hypothetical protein
MSLKAVPAFKREAKDWEPALWATAVAIHQARQVQVEAQVLRDQAAEARFL